MIWIQIASAIVLFRLVVWVPFPSLALETRAKAWVLARRVDVSAPSGISTLSVRLCPNCFASVMLDHFQLFHLFLKHVVNRTPLRRVFWRLKKGLPMRRWQTVREHRRSGFR